jgi:hypothetical protein
MNSWFVICVVGGQINNGQLKCTYFLINLKGCFLGQICNAALRIWMLGDEAREGNMQICVFPNCLRDSASSPSSSQWHMVCPYIIIRSSWPGRKFNSHVTCTIHLTKSCIIFQVSHGITNSRFKAVARLHMHAPWSSLLRERIIMQSWLFWNYLHDAASPCS